MRFTRQSGLATWCRDNMGVRYQMAVHIRPDEPGEEEPVNEVTRAGNSDVFRCDLPLMDEAHALDAVATLGAIIGQSQPHPDPDGAEPSWAEYHRCDHADDARGGCVVVDRREGPV